MIDYICQNYHTIATNGGSGQPKKTLNMIFHHAGAALRGRFLNSWHAGLCPDVITRAKFQVDQSKVLEATAYWCLKSGACASHDRRPYNSVTHYRDTL